MRRDKEEEMLYGKFEEVPLEVVTEVVAAIKLNLL